MFYHRAGSIELKSEGGKGARNFSLSGLGGAEYFSSLFFVVARGMFCVNIYELSKYKVVGRYEIAVIDIVENVKYQSFEVNKYLFELQCIQ